MHYKLINEMTDDELNDFFYFEEFSSRRSQEIENIVANDLERNNSSIDSSADSSSIVSVFLLTSTQQPNFSDH